MEASHANTAILMQRPPWLEDEPEILALLNAFLDKLDRKPATEWKQAPTIPVDAKRLPDLFRHDEAADQQWALLKSLDGTLFETRLNRRRALHDPEYLGASLRLRLEAEGTLRDWLGRPRERPYGEQWREAVAQHAAVFADGGAVLAARALRLPGTTAEALAGAFARIADHTDIELTLRQLSARCFWGHSKFLDNREALLGTLFPQLIVRPRPVLVHVHLPARAEGLLFIENQESYVRALEGHPEAVTNLCRIYVAGFRGAAERIRQHAGAAIHFHGRVDAEARVRFEAWWFGDAPADRPLWFWGDLDFAGMAILKALRSRFGNVQAWQPGYAPLLERLEAGSGHAPETTDKSEQYDPGETGNPWADQVLLPAMRRYQRFVDQEAL